MALGASAPQSRTQSEESGTRLRGVSAPCDRGPPLGAPLAALFNPGRAFQDGFAILISQLLAGGP
jgi:hypothetical protein